MFDAEQSGVAGAGPVEGGDLDGLAALGVDDLEFVAGLEEEGGDGAALDAVALGAGGDVGQSGDAQAGLGIGRHGRHGRHEWWPSPRVTRWWVDSCTGNAF